MTRKLLAFTCLLLIAAVPAFACLWDSDTLQMERLRFPGVLEIITGKFVRHSRAYHEWRIGDRSKKLEATPDDPALIDDLAVAYAKLGRAEDGIPLLKKALETHPGRYETLSNLGTLLFFAGRLDESKQYIRRALEINPDAHFGRERYQLLLTEYLQQSEWPQIGMMSSKNRYRNESHDFWNYVMQARLPQAVQRAGNPNEEYRQELKAATTGVLGMMHFADFESPILLEAIGDLMASGDDEQHAARAYLRAAQFSSTEFAKKRFRILADEVLELHERVKLSHIEGHLAGEVDDAREWFKDIEANEQRWIAENLDVDREFAAVYYDSLESTIAAATEDLKEPPREPPIPSGVIPLENTWAAPLAGIVLAIGLAMLVLYSRAQFRVKASPARLTEAANK